MKRFWLWSTLAGAVLLPLVSLGCLYIIASLFPHPRVPINIPLILRHTAFKFVIAGAGFGFCTLTLWMGRRRVGWRLLSAAYGLTATAYCIFVTWRDFTRSTFPSAKMYILMLDTLALGPSVVWGLALLFFALLMRARPKNSSI